jgi:tRNA(Ile2) C34 agmatinyltransferase TiaS
MKHFTLTFIIASVLLSSCGDSNPSDVANSTKDAVKQEAPAIVISAPVLAKAYDDNEVSADNTYKGKKVKISGTIEDIGKDIVDAPYITLSSGEEFSAVTVQCMIDDHASVAALKKGQRVTVIGKVSGKMMNVLVEDCTISK